MNPFERCLSGFCRLLPRGEARVVGALDGFYRESPPRRVSVGEVPVTLHPATTFERLMLYRAYEHRMIRFACSLLRPGDVAVDAGAHIGWLSAHFLQAVARSGAVHSFEPVPEFFARLEESAAAARSLGYRWIAASSALGERRETLTLALGNENNPCFNTLIPEFTREGLRKGTIPVPVVPLDEYLESGGVGEVRLLKVDTEGAEGMVLRGAARSLEAKRIRYLLVEISPQAEQAAGRERGDSIRFLRERGYVGYLLQHGRLKPLPEAHDYWVADTFWEAPA